MDVTGPMTHSGRVLIGMTCALVSAFAWMAANASIAGAARRFGSIGAIVWAQLLGGPLVVVAAVALEGAPTAPDAAGVAGVLIAGAAAAAAYFGLFEALKHGQLSVVSPITSGWAVISIGVGVALFGEALTGWRAVGVGLVIAGNVLLGASVARRRDGPRETPPYALAMALLSALGFGALVPATEAAGAAVGRLWAVPLVWGVELLFALPWLLRHRLVGRRPRGRREWFVAGRVGAFEGLGFVALSLALGFAPIGVVSPVASLATGLSVLWGVAVLGERLRRRALAGAVLASVGVVLVGL